MDAQRLVRHLLYKKETTMIVKALVSIVVAVVILAACYGAYKHGVNVGIHSYHNQCYNIGGFIVDEVGHVVACAPQGTIPKEELNNFKDTI